MALGEKIKAKPQQRLRQHAGGDVFDCPVIKRPPGSFNTHGKNIDRKCLHCVVDGMWIHDSAHLGIF